MLADVPICASINLCTSVLSRIARLPTVSWVDPPDPHRFCMLLAASRGALSGSFLAKSHIYAIIHTIPPSDGPASHQFMGRLTPAARPAVQGLLTRTAMAPAATCAATSELEQAVSMASAGPCTWSR